MTVAAGCAGFGLLSLHSERKLFTIEGNGIGSLAIALIPRYTNHLQRIPYNSASFSLSEA